MILSGLVLVFGVSFAASQEASYRGIEDPAISEEVRNSILDLSRSRLSKIHRPLEKVLDEVTHKVMELKYRGRIHEATPQMNQILNDILVPNQLEKVYPWKLHYVQDSNANIVSTSYGRIYVFEGILRLGLSQEEFAGVLAHEIAHVLARHVRRRFEIALGVSAATTVSLSLLQSHLGVPATAGSLVFLAESLAFLKMSRGEEFASDELATTLLKRTPYRCMALAGALEKGGMAKTSWARKILRYFDTHPPTPERVEFIQNLCSDPVPDPET